MSNDNQLGLALAEQGANRAADRAGNTWQERATLALHIFLARRIAITFTCEDVRTWARDYMGVTEPPDRRAWGAVFMAAVREDRIRKHGYRPHLDLSRHHGISTVWERVP